VWFGLSEIEGNKNTKMYDGSMAEWAADPARPVQPGS
jgi:thiosulfate/3-mercaptopyruvate sulfurtransferase